jgi:uncharacterized damage-inducible protein DinB
MGLTDPNRMEPLLKQYAAYNLWANERVAAKLKTVDVELLDAEVRSSFPSLRRTITHIWDAELIWLSRLEGKKISWPPTAQFPDPAIDDFLKTSRDLNNFVEGKSEGYFASDTSYSDSKGTPYTMNNAGLLMHVFNHSTFHRGQVVTLLRELGQAEIPATDLVRYLREMK